MATKQPTSNTSDIPAFVPDEMPNDEDGLTKYAIDEIAYQNLILRSARWFDVEPSDQNDDGERCVVQFSKDGSAEIQGYFYASKVLRKALHTRTLPMRARIHGGTNAKKQRYWVFMPPTEE